MREALTRRRLAGLGGCVAVVAVIVLVLLIGGEDKSHAVPEGGASPVATDRGTTPTAPAQAAKAPSAPSAPPRAEDRPAAGLPTSRARAAARMLLVGFGGPQLGAPTLQLLGEREWGGVVLEPGNGASPQQVADVVAQVRDAAARARHQMPLIAASQLGGDLDAVPVGAPSQARAADAKAARAAALGSAKALHPLGVRMVLGPDADIGFAGGPWEGVAFADDAGTVAAMTAAAVSGWKDGEIAPAPGHFPGEGAASGDPALEAATVGLSREELAARDLEPFKAIARHAPAIQLSAATYVAWDGVTPATLLPDVVELLRGELRFDGVVVSGDLQAASLAGGEPVSALAVQAIKAGVDLVWIPGDAGDQEAAWRAVVRALRSGDIPAARVADALRRVDALRRAYGVK